IVIVTGRGNLRRFHRRIARRFLDPRKRRMARMLAAPEAGRASRDVVPVGVKHLIDSERRRHRMTWGALGQQAGAPVPAICSADGSRRGYRRWVIARLAHALGSPELRTLAESDLYWDRISAIEPVGVRPTYDLSIEGDHNFLANDLVVHNSHAASFALLAYASA